MSQSMTVIWQFRCSPLLNKTNVAFKIRYSYMANLEITGMLLDTIIVDLSKKVIVTIFCLVLKCCLWVRDFLGCISHAVISISLSKICITLHKITSTTSKNKYGLKVLNNYKNISYFCILLIVNIIFPLQKYLSSINSFLSWIIDCWILKVIRH